MAVVMRPVNFGILEPPAPVFIRRRGDMSLILYDSRLSYEDAVAKALHAPRLRDIEADWLDATAAALRARRHFRGLGPF